MEYGKLKPTESARYSENIPRTQTQTQTRKDILVKYALVTFLVLFFLVMLVASLTIILIVVINHKHHYKTTPIPPLPSLINDSNHSPVINDSNYSPGLSLAPSSSSSSMSLTRVCAVTRYPSLCVTSLGKYMSRQKVDVSNNNNNNNNHNVDEAVFGHGEVVKVNVVVQVSLNVTIERLRKGLKYLMMEIKGLDEIKESFQWSAHDDCVGFIQDSVDLLTRARPLLIKTLSSNYQGKSYVDDLMTWMATVCANQDTCTEGFEEAGGPLKHQTAKILQELWQIISNHLDLSCLVVNCDVVSGRKLMGLETTNIGHKTLGHPKWMSRKYKQLLGLSLGRTQPNVTVSHRGIGPNVTVTSIKEAIDMAPKNSNVPFIIHIKAGRYQEVNLTVGRSKTNLWFIGAGKGRTIITGSKSVRTHNITTIKTATFGVTGSGFVARGITFESTAGPQNHQAVALLVKSEHSVFYECEVKGYQDTLYVHSSRQFYRNCDIYGTIDFIFGKAQAVFQNCTIYSRRPMEQQTTNTIVAHKRPCNSLCTGISIHECQIRAAPDLEPVKSNYTTYLGRPWNEQATTVYMLSYIGDHIDPKGWIKWNSTTTLDNVYYGEFMNYGPGANTSQRVVSLGVHVNMSVPEAARFTVDRFVDGSSWIGHTKVPFQAGLRN